MPHSSSIRTWAANVDHQPGYLTNVIQLIGKVAEQKHWMRDVELVIDAMTLHSGTVWDPKSRSYVGTVDYRAAAPEATYELATEALVFMLVGMTGHW